jgi:hypothetical protein
MILCPEFTLCLEIPKSILNNNIIVTGCGISGRIDSTMGGGLWSRRTSEISAHVLLE